MVHMAYGMDMDGLQRLFNLSGMFWALFDVHPLRSLQPALDRVFSVSFVERFPYLSRMVWGGANFIPDTPCHISLHNYVFPMLYFLMAHPN